MEIHWQQNLLDAPLRFLLFNCKLFNILLVRKQNNVGDFARAQITRYIRQMFFLFLILFICSISTTISSFEFNCVQKLFFIQMPTDARSYLKNDETFFYKRIIAYANNCPLKFTDRSKCCD